MEDNPFDLVRRYELILHDLRIVGAAKASALPFDEDADVTASQLEDGTLVLEVRERGRVSQRRAFRNSDDALYELATSAVHIPASRLAAASSAENEDTRQTLFAEELRLLGTIDDGWRRRREREIEQILREFPFAPSREPEAWPIFRKRGRGAALLIAVGLAALIALHLPLWQVWQKERDLLANGIVVEAEIQSMQTTRLRFWNSHTLDLRYRVPGGRQFAISFPVGPNFADAARVGEMTEIRVDPDAPRQAIIAVDDRSGRLSIIYLIVDALLAMAALGIVRDVRRRRAAGPAGSRRRAGD